MAKDNQFTLYGGQRFRDGKVYYPHIVRLRIAKKDALDIAMRILTELRSNQTASHFVYLEDIILSGKIEKVPNE